MQLWLQTDDEGFHWNISKLVLVLNWVEALVMGARKTLKYWMSSSSLYYFFWLELPSGIPGPSNAQESLKKYRYILNGAGSTQETWMKGECTSPWDLSVSTLEYEESWHCHIITHYHIWKVLGIRKVSHSIEKKGNITHVFKKKMRRAAVQPASLHSLGLWCIKTSWKPFPTMLSKRQ